MFRDEGRAEHLPSSDRCKRPKRFNANRFTETKEHTMKTAQTRVASNLKGARGSNRFSADERGINMVDLMMWLVVAALLLAAALQGIGYYQKGANVYVLKNDLSNAASVAHAQAALTSGTIDDAALNATLAQTKLSNGTTLNWGTLSVTAAAELKQPGDAPVGFERTSVATSVNGLVYVLSATNAADPSTQVYLFLERTAGNPEGIKVAAPNSVAVTTGGTVTAGANTVPSSTASPTPTALTADQRAWNDVANVRAYMEAQKVATGSYPTQSGTASKLIDTTNGINLTGGAVTLTGSNTVQVLQSNATHWMVVIDNLSAESAAPGGMYEFANYNYTCSLTPYDKTLNTGILPQLADGYIMRHMQAGC